MLIPARFTIQSAVAIVPPGVTGTNRTVSYSHEFFALEAERTNNGCGTAPAYLVINISWFNESSEKSTKCLKYFENTLKINLI